MSLWVGNHDPPCSRTKAFHQFVLSADVLKEHIGNVPVTVWNDAPERTAEDVAAAFEAAADRLDAATDTADAGPTPGAATN